MWPRKGWPFHIILPQAKMIPLLSLSQKRHFMRLFSLAEPLLPPLVVFISNTRSFHSSLRPLLAYSGVVWHLGVYKSYNITTHAH